MKMNSFTLICLLIALVTVSVAWGRYSNKRARDFQNSGCPRTDLNETAQDCPFAGWARALETSTSKTDAQKFLQTSAPEIISQITKDKNAGLSKYWSNSRNADESNLSKPIVQPEILHAFADWAGLPEPDSKAFTFHAGFLHTYGYLFSTLQTPYGYKRARWVDQEIEKGFDLPKGHISPFPSQGTLLSNVTEFARKFSQTMAMNAGAVRVIEVNAQNTVELQTDLVPFVKTAGLKNAAVLIYSLRHNPNGLTNQDPLKLVTVFPINAASLKAYTPTADETQTEIKLRYNATLLPDSSESKWQGSRKVKK